MFTSIFSHRWLKWATCPKLFIVNLEIRIGKDFIFIHKKAEARFRYDAIFKAKNEVKEEIEIIVCGSKSLGKVNKLKAYKDYKF